MIPPDGVGRLLFTRERLRRIANVDWLRRIATRDWRTLDLMKLIVVEAVLSFGLLYLFTHIR